MKYITLTTTILLIIFACNRKINTLTTSEKIDNKSVNTDTNNEQSKIDTITNILKLGKIVHETKCFKCHEIHQPNLLTKTEWSFWVSKMAPKAKLSTEEFNQLETYLHYYAKVN